MMRNPFLIDGPAVISFSGGRTSGYMLWRILQAHGWKLPDDVRVVFANTGKEAPETLLFVADCAKEWQVPITWIEYREADNAEDRWCITDFDGASRNGEPFDAIIKRRNYLPNPVARFCTVELKIFPMERYAHFLGFDDYLMVIGLRADEERRAAKVISNPSGNRAGYERIIPLYHAHITKRMVSEFWSGQNFDLGLENHNGVTPDGNCDLCFLKGYRQIYSAIRKTPSKAVWWIKAQNSIVDNGQISGNAARFRSDRPGYDEMLDAAMRQGDLIGYDESIEDCACTD